MNPTVSIIIPIFSVDDEVVEHARRCIASIKEHTENYELIIVDNGGIQNTQEWQKEADVYLLNKINVGYGPAINQGFKIARGEFLCAMNDDVIVSENWLPPLLEAFSNPLTGVVRPGEEREVGSGLVDDHTWYHGFTWIIKRELWQSMKDEDGNLLDEQFLIGYFEDLDLWVRILNRHLRLMKQFNSSVFHYGGLTIHKMEELSDIKLANEERFIKKHGIDYWMEQFYPIDEI